MCVPEYSLPSNIHVYVIYSKVLHVSSCNGFPVVTLVLYYSIQIHRYFRHGATYIDNLRNLTNNLYTGKLVLSNWF